MRKFKLGLFFLVIFSILLATSQDTITFQGFLTDSNGMVVNGDKYVAFKIWTAKTGGTEILNASGGSDFIANIRKVTVYNGNYATKIQFTAAGLTKLNAAADAWMEVYVGSSSFSESSMPAANKLTPRIQLTSTPYALNVRGIIYDNTNSNVGIGPLAAPLSNKLHVKSAGTGPGAANGGLAIQGTTDGTAPAFAYADLVFLDNTGRTVSKIGSNFNGTTGGGLYFITNDNYSGSGTERIRILPNGNVGIGFTAPAAKLAINGGLNIGDIVDPGDNNLNVVGNGTFAGGTINIGADTSIYRSAANALKTDDSFEAVNNINSSSGAIQTAGSTRISNAGAYTGTTGTFSGNINSSGGAIQTGGTTRIDNSGNLSSIGDVAMGGNLTGAASKTITGFTGGVWQAVWNDLAEFRPLAKGQKVVPGKCYVATKKGVVISSKRAEIGTLGICSDTFGFSLGGAKGDKTKAPIAISGWALAYVDKDYPIGTALISGPNGVLTAATLKEKRDYPERIVGIVDVKPDKYNKIKIDGRYWVKVK